MFKPAVSFYFQVSFSNSDFKGEDELLFAEVSGLEMEIETVSVSEGGNNGVAIQLPGKAVYKDIVLKRAMLTKTSKIYAWFQNTIKWDYKKLTVVDFDISLLDENGETCANWKVSKSYPKKVVLTDMNATASGDNAIMVETLTFTHKGIERTK